MAQLGFEPLATRAKKALGTAVLPTVLWRQLEISLAIYTYNHIPPPFP